jgi:hypothetical protein
MLIQFTVTADDSIWITDTQFLKWARVSSLGADPESKVLESGKLTPQGFGIYNFEGRTPKQGLCSIGTYIVGVGAAIKIYLRANVLIKDFTMPVPIRQILYEILPSDPKQIEHSIQEMTDEGNQAPQGSEESAGERTLPETAARGELSAPETSMEFRKEDLGADTHFGELAAPENH